MKDAVTLVLKDLVAGDRDAVDRLLPYVYDELYALSQRHLRGQAGKQTLQPTALVHEAYIRLVHQQHAGYKDRSHFIAVAVMAMRQILIDHARKRSAAKRGGRAQQITLNEQLDGRSDHDVDLIALNEALERLNQLDDRKARVVELRFFGGLSLEEISDVLEVARSTVAEDWRFARAWLAQELSDDD